MKLTEQEKLEMLEDGLDKNRRNDFRTVETLHKSIDWKEYNLWLNQIQTTLPKPIHKRFVKYNNVLI